MVRTPLVAALLAATVVACSPPPQQAATPAPDFGRILAGKINVDGIYTQLRKFVDIAAANKGSRADGTPGYDASVDYVANTLRDKGFDVQTPEYQRLVPGPPGHPTLEIGGRMLPVDQASLLVPTPAGGLSAPALHAVKPAGCTAADYGTLNLRGAIAVVDDSGCSVVDKQNVAVARGAVALLVRSVPGPNGSPPGLFPSGYYAKLTTPVAVIGGDADTALLQTSAAVRLTMDRKASTVTSRNVVAQTKTGDTHNVVMVGAHLDSAIDRPGVNDNATGVAALLETAAALGGSPNVANAVRFTFWGSGAAGQEGSTKYVRGLDAGSLNDIALYLDFGMLGSPNAGFFTYDGDQSGQPSPAIAADSVPVGSAGLKRSLAGYLYLAGKHPADMTLSLATDYAAFLTAGVPIGGITTGSSQRKSAVQARLWGGQAGVSFDPGYGTPRDMGDKLDALNRDALAVTCPAVAFAVGTYAQSLGGPNGVPAREQRHRSASN